MICVPQVHYSLKAVPLLLWHWSTEPWQRIYVDYAEVKGERFLLLVDDHSKWMEVFCKCYHRSLESSVFLIWAATCTEQ